MTRGQVPSRISTKREITYLRTLAETGNATIAAARAGVSRTWAYKRREVDARFDALCREMAARFRETRPASEPPHPTLSPRGRGDKRVRVNRDRAGGWTAATEARFLAALAATGDVPLAASSVGKAAASAYTRRQMRPGFAQAWAEALESGREMQDLDWFESAECFFEGREPTSDNPVRVTSVAEVLRMLARSERAGREAPRE